MCTGAQNEVQRQESIPREEVEENCGPVMSLQCTKLRGYERWGHPSSLRLCQSLIVRLTNNETLWKHPYRAEPATSWRWQRLKTSLNLQCTHRLHNWPAETGLDLKPALCKNEKWVKLQIKVLLIQSMIILCSARNYKLIRIEPWWGTGSLAGRLSCVCVCVCVCVCTRK